MEAMISDQGVACRVMPPRPLSKWQFSIPRSELFGLLGEDALDPSWAFVVTTRSADNFYLFDIGDCKNWPAYMGDNRDCWYYKGYRAIDNSSPAGKRIKDLFGSIPWKEQIAEIV